jgi:hypothetical protein
MQKLLPRKMKTFAFFTPVFFTPVLLVATLAVAWAAPEGDVASQVPAASEAAPASEKAPAAAPAKAEPDEPDESEKSDERGDQPVALPHGLRLGGFFDASYERAGRSGDLGSGANGFRSYHHFLFLSRQGDGVPVGFNAELLGLHFYELTARLSGKGWPVRVTAHAGKILVPFGPDPLFHKNYGGQSGVDQKLLPVIWSAIGGGLRFSATWGKLAIADEAYCVQGYDLPARDQTLDMQRDLVAYDGARVAAGNRLAISSGPFSLWYSLYWNPMRFGRHLVMQALDLTVWRPAVPFLNRLAMGVGAVRAHVSADETFGRSDAVAGAGAYFHFADYVWLRAFLGDWVYVQARSGLATFGNRAGLYYDANRAGAEDGSHHNVALVVEHAGAQASLAYFWNFEKIDEVASDLLRLTVSYAF